MIKVSGKVDKSNIYNGFGSKISFFIQGKTSFKNYEFFNILAIEEIDKIVVKL